MRKWVWIGVAAAAIVAGIAYAIIAGQKPANTDKRLAATPTPPGVESTAGTTPESSPNVKTSPTSSPNKGNNGKVTQQSPSPSPQTESLEGPVLVAGGSRAASNLNSETGCRDDDPTKGFADLSWTPAAQRGSEQRLQVTIFREGFESGNFEVSESLAADRSSYRWSRPRGQAIHYWRVLTRHDDGWVPSETAKFEGPSCVGV